MGKKKLVHKTKVVPFINVGTDSAPDWRRIEKSKTFTLSMNPQVKTYDYISSEIPEEGSPATNRALRRVLPC